MWFQRPDQTIMYDDSLSLKEKFAHHYTHRKSMFDDVFMNKWGPRSVVAMMLTGTPLAVLVVFPEYYDNTFVLRAMQVGHCYCCCCC